MTEDSTRPDKRFTVYRDAFGGMLVRTVPQYAPLTDEEWQTNIKAATASLRRAIDMRGRV